MCVPAWSLVFLVMHVCVLLFFKQKTAYEMRISDWSSDVCSSDLAVERRGRLVEHDEARLQHHGAGDGDALALPAGEFVRIAIAGLGIEVDLLERLHDEPVAHRGIGADAVHRQPLLDALPHRHARAQRPLWVRATGLPLSPPPPPPP